MDPTTADVDLADRIREGREKILTEVRKVIIGQDEAVEHVLLTLFVGGNSLLIGVPGLAKTLLIHTIAQVLDLDFSRIQFTPDLMPSDITGTDIIQQRADGSRGLEFAPGPIFANVVLADEVNRTPPKTQAALLEAMQEHRVTVQGKTFELDPPFFVFATQNPIELEGTYPLPEAQLDRFMFLIRMEHLEEEEEMEVVRSTTDDRVPDLSPVVSKADLIAFQELVRRVPVADAVLRYAVGLVRASRPSANGSHDFINKWVSYGASVRAAQYLILGGKARALTQGRLTVSFEDIRALAAPVLRHRILTNFHAESEGRTTDELVTMILKAVPTPSSGM
ncbi:MAG: AAA family ATPase [Gemmatimonadota bacterium]|nr:AAA family ATPase [Gemmatimonadota bacterium]